MGNDGHCDDIAVLEPDDGAMSKTDICGAVGIVFGDGNSKNSAPSGFITSPNYPQRYSPDTNCQCVLNASSDQAQGRTEVLIQVRRYIIGMYKKNVQVLYGATNRTVSCC